MAEQEKVDCSDDRRLKQMEIEKLRDLLENLIKRNEDRIESKI